MSIWKEIKYALNGTLGTENFRPLDRILSESKTWSAANAFNMGDRHNNAVYIFSEDTATIEGVNKMYFKAKFLTPGSFAIANYSNSDITNNINIDINGTVKTLTGIRNDSAEIVSYPKNATVKIYTSSDFAVSITRRPSIYAIVVDTPNVQFL